MENGGPRRPCARCRHQRKRCQADCIFAPYFPPGNPERFLVVHSVFTANNVDRVLQGLLENQREAAVNSMFHDATIRLQDPVGGCYGMIMALQQEIQALRIQLHGNPGDRNPPGPPA